jgi:DNA-binding MarR family transcriptional regulator
VDNVETKLSDAEMRAWQAFLHAHHQVTRRLDAELRSEHELPLNAYDVLLRLARAPDQRLRMTDLAERVMMSPSGLTRVVDRLAAQGLVKRERFAGDARVMHATLTEDGRRVLRRAARTHLHGIREHFTSQMTKDQLQQVASALEILSGPHHPH